MSRTKTAIVTGANRGLGLETAKALAKRGYRVIRTSRNPSADEKPLDVANEESIAAFASALRKDDVTVDVLVNNAGMSMNGFDEEVARRTLETNFFGSLHVTEALLPLVPDHGTIVMVSSGMGELSCVSSELRRELQGEGLTRDALVAKMKSFVADVARGKHEKAGWPSSAYRVSKVGLNALTRVLARELASRHIRVNAVCPGWVRTDMGGENAERSVEEGAASIVWAATLEDDTTGGFFRDGNRIPW